MTDIHPTAIVDKGAELADGVEVGPYSVIGPNVRLGAGTRIRSHVVLDGRTTLGRDCTMFPFACIGTQTQDLKYEGGETFVEIGDGTTLREYVTVNSGTNEGEVTRVGSRCHIMAYAHVAHACRVGDEVIMANCATLAGEVVVEDQAILGGLSAFHQFVRVGRLCMVGGMARISQDCPPFTLVAGEPAGVRGINVIGLKRRGFGPEVAGVLKEAYRHLYRSDLTTSNAVKRIREELEMTPELEHLVTFIEQSERGIIRV